MKAAIYVRVSTPRQALKGESISMQKERLTAYIKAQGWKLYKIYEDKGFSGKNTARPAFQEMMKDAESRLFDVLVVYKIDRLSRSILDFHTTIEKLKKYNISFVSVTQQFDTTTSTGRLMLAILVDFANFEREIDVDRAIDSFQQRLQNGLPSGAIPYGYKRLKGNKVVIVPDEAEKVKEIYQLALKRYSMSEIAQKMGFSVWHVRSILRQPFYCGYLVRRRNGKNKRIPEEQWEWYKGQHKAIISLKTYQDVSQIRHSRAKNTKTKYARLFSKLIYCPYCEHNLSFHTRHWKNKKEITFYYICEKISRESKACSQYVNESKMEDLLLSAIEKLVNIDIKKDNKFKENNIEKELKQIDRKIRRLVALSERTGNVQEVARRINELKKRREEILKTPKKERTIDAREIKRIINNITNVYQYMSREEKAHFWHLAINRIIAYRDKFVIEWNGLGTTEVPREFNNKSSIGNGGGGRIRTFDTPGMSRML